MRQSEAGSARIWPGDLNQALTSPSFPVGPGERVLAGTGLQRWISLVVVRGTTMAVSPPMTWKGLFSRITVTVLPAWMIPAWIF
jgi:hypothetical protein